MNGVPALSAVLFDVGDTLIRLRGEPGGLLVQAAGELGVSVDPEAASQVWGRVLAQAGTPDELAKGRDLSTAQHRAVWTALYAAAGSEALAPGLAEALYRVSVEPASWEPFLDTLTTLRALAARGVPVGVLSDTGFDLRPVLDPLGILPLLDTVVMSLEHGVCKPDPRLFDLACRQLGVPAEHTLMVGDSALTDAGGVAAGMTVLLLPRTPAGAPRGLARALALVDGR